MSVVIYVRNRLLVQYSLAYLFHISSFYGKYVVSLSESKGMWLFLDMMPELSGQYAMYLLSDSNVYYI